MSATNIQVSRTEKMPDMPSSLVKKFLPLLEVQSNGDNEKRMVLYIVKILEQMGLSYEIDQIGNILVTKGSAAYFPCIASHMDTVHNFYDTFKVKVEQRQGRQLAKAFSEFKQEGVGGDDKCGIFACFYMLNKFDNIKAVFFTQEETGLIGSSEVDYEWFNDVGYIIQLDRWGRSDLICINSGQQTVSEDFLEKVEPSMLDFGFLPEEGLITDSINLWNNGIGVSCVNVSCGYYQHHSSTENIDLNEFWNSLKFTYSMILSLGEQLYPSQPVYKRKNTKPYYYNNVNDHDFEWSDYYKKEEDKQENPVKYIWSEKEPETDNSASFNARRWSYNYFAELDLFMDEIIGIYGNIDKDTIPHVRQMAYERFLILCNDYGTDILEQDEFEFLMSLSHSPY